jgi:hypothetical protein
MKTSPVSTVLAVGADVMGTGIAQIAAAFVGTSSVGARRC